MITILLKVIDWGLFWSTYDDRLDDHAPLDDNECFVASNSLLSRSLSIAFCCAKILETFPEFLEIKTNIRVCSDVIIFARKINTYNEMFEDNELDLVSLNLWIGLIRKKSILDRRVM